jgi:hypothetical protein
LQRPEPPPGTVTLVMTEEEARAVLIVLSTGRASQSLAMSDLRLENPAVYGVITEIDGLAL